MNEINFDVSNLKLNMFTNIEEVELYDLTCEYSSILLFKINTHTHTYTHKFMIFFNKWMNAFHTKNFQQI
jgi:hypothetical protein